MRTSVFHIRRNYNKGVKLGDSIKVMNPTTKHLTDGKEYVVERIESNGQIAVKNDTGRVKPYARTNFQVGNNEIVEHLKKVDTYKTGDKLVTTYDGKKISQSPISKKYFDFDFPGFVIDLLDEIDKYFTPETYSLRINGGFQEIRLFGEKMEINGAEYTKMFSLLNSTNRCYALQMNIGLHCVKNNSSIILGSYNDDNLGVTSRHFYIALPNRVERFIEKLKDFDMILEQHCGLIKDLSDENLSYRTIVTNFLSENTWKNEITEMTIGKAKSLGKMLQESTNYRIEGLDAEQVKLLNNPMTALKNNKVDIELSGIQVLGAYTELFKNCNTAIQKTETNKILKAMGR